MTVVREESVVRVVSARMMSGEMGHQCEGGECGGNGSTVVHRITKLSDRISHSNAVGFWETSCLIA
jgi:hypothetical protein